MANLQNERTAEHNDVAGRIVRICILIIVSFVVAIAAVSFAVHHMRLQFEEEFKKISDAKMQQVTDVVRMSVDGDDLVSNTVNAPARYSALLDLMLADTSTENLSAEGYGLFGYNQGQLSLLLSRGVNDPSEFAVASRDISEWLGGSNSQTVITGKNYESIIVPITDSTGMCVGVFEYKCTFGVLYDIGDKLESRILTAVIIAVLAGVVLFAVQEVLIRLIRGRQGGASGKKNTETPQNRDRRLISSTIGYCFTIILVVLLVMATQLSKTYIKALESERADMMEKCAVSSAAALTYTEVRENMSYMLPVYKYGNDKSYIVNIYTMAGDSFLRLYSSTSTGNVQQYYLTGAGNQYIDCFGLQQAAFTSRNEGGTSYVCAIAPIISSENTVSGVLEVMMPRSDFESSVNGMSLSWIFTIISIAISMGIMIFELNLLISTISKGISGNAPVLVMYGENANRFLSFFTAFGSVMMPVAFADYFKEQLDYLPMPAVQGFICVTLLLYIWGYLGFAGIRNSIKMKFTSRIALIAITCAGYFFALIAGVISFPYLTAVLALPTGFCFGMTFDYLRDYRINAGRLGYKDYNDRMIHNVQSSSYFLGVSVGAVIAGICYERYGLFVVTIISGAALVLTSIGMIYFMQNNTQVREAPLSISGFLSVFADSKIARFLNSSFLMLGVALAFMLMFIPNYLDAVGISLPTTSFYFMVCGFTACFVCGFVKNKFAHLLTSRTRVLIQAASTVLGLFLFALMPSAKMLVVTCAFLGIALGIHDYYYIYVLYLICNGKIKANLRKLAEYTVYMGAGLMLPIIMVSFIVNNVRITFLILTLIVAILAFIYPLSSFSGKIDERDISLKPQKKQRSKSASKAAPAFGTPTGPQAPADARLPEGNVMSDPAGITDPQVDAVIPGQQYNDAYSQQDAYQAQQYSQPAPQAPVQQQYQQYSQPVEQQYQQSVQPQYQQPVQQYDQPVEQQYQQPPQQQYSQPVQQQYQPAPDQYAAQQYGAQTGDPYAGSSPAQYGTQPQQAPSDPLAFLNGDENEGGGRNG
ncbi:MAG: hypothetical protein IKG03_02345 [Clostridiales bacterium]|nr:hypothetical protein [Clostridiales bacterium]